MKTNIRVVWYGERPYGLEDISGGNENAHWRYRTPDGKRHHSQRAAVRHLKDKALERLGNRWGVAVERG